MKKNLLSLFFLFVGMSLFAQTPRLSLVEEFTGETCPPCAAYNPAFNTLLKNPNNISKVVAIKWQVPIPSAPTKTWSLYQTNKAEINSRYSAYGYGINSAPSVRIDGQMPTVFGAAGQNITQQTNAVFATAQSYTSAFSVTMSRAWNKTCTAVDITVNITASAPFTSQGSLVFRTVMVEETIQFTVQPGTNGETKFEDVAIKSFPSIQAGTPLPGTWTLGQTHSFTLSCPIPSYCRDKEEIAMVGFIQDDGNRKVAQAVRAGTMQLPPDALAAISANVNLTCNNVITPTVVVENSGTLNPINSLTLTPFLDGLAAAPTVWTGNIAVGASEVITLNTMTATSLSGSHNFTVGVEMNSPLYNLTKNSAKTSYMVATSYQGNPVVEGFILGTYPPAGWGIVNGDAGSAWSRNTGAGAYNISPLESSKYDFFTNSVIGDKDDLYLPPLDLTNCTDASMTFDIAYAQRNSTSDDALEVMVSDNCGANWTAVYYSHGTALSTTTPKSTAYTPDSNDPSHWRTESADLSAFQNKSNVLVKFVTTSDNGNNLYLDNVNLVFKNTGFSSVKAADKMSVALYPNPANTSTSIKINALKSGDAKITVTNTLGQVVYTKGVSLTEGSNTIQMDVKDFASGIYNVSISTTNGSVVKKLDVTK